MTGVGVLLGTAAYMPPEQAKGRLADKRSDIWAFGCVLFEMLTGQRAFRGDDVAEVMVSVLSKEPDWPPADAAEHSRNARGIRLRVCDMDEASEDEDTIPARCGRVVIVA